MIRQRIDRSLEKALTGRNLLLFHLFACSLGLLGMSQFLSRLLFSLVLPEYKPPLINDYFSHFFFPQKPFELMHYALTIIFLFLYYCIAYYLVYKRDPVRLIDHPLDNKYNIILMCIIVLIINLVLSQPVNTATPSRFIQGALFWLISFILPYFYNIYTYRYASCVHNISLAHMPIIYYIIIVCISFQLIHVFIPFICKSIYVMNPYYDIPEESLLSAPDKERRISLNEYGRQYLNNESRYVDNTLFINSHFLYGNTNKYDLRNDLGHDSPPKELSYIGLPMTSPLAAFLEDSQFNSDSSYYYNARVGALTVIDRMTSRIRDELSSILTTEDQSRQLDALYSHSNVFQDEIKNRRHSAAELEFLGANRFELHWQILDRWVIHHHNFVLGPIHEYAHGKPLKDMYMQYGFLNVVVMKELLSWFGGITYPNYFRVWYSFYYVYYGLFVILLFFLFKDVGYVLLATLLSFAVINGIGYHFLFIAPGLNPVRHFFDIFVIGFFYSYLCKGKATHLCAAFLFSILGILNNSQIGLFAFAALMTTLLVRVLIERDNGILKNFLTLGTMTAIGLCIFIYSDVGKVGLSKYYLSGLLGFPFDYVCQLAVVFSFIYVLLLGSLLKHDSDAYLLLFMLLYSQALLLYFVWGKTEYHFMNFANIYIITFTVLIRIMINKHEYINSKKDPIIVFLLICAAVLYIWSTRIYYNEAKEYNAIFNQHRIYKWPLDNANWESTMNPEYFNQAVEIIRTYSNNSGIYIISKYDSLLPFLSDKYSKMPFPELSYYLVSSKESMESLDIIDLEKPEFLFVDTDINRNFNTDIVNSDAPAVGYLHEESVWRTQRLNLLKALFNAVKASYEPVEQGYLITVYKRKS